MSRIVGRVFPDNAEPMNIRQDIYAQPDGNYEIQDTEKRAEYENLKTNHKN